jgi:hypothetical protein
MGRSLLPRTFHGPRRLEVGRVGQTHLPERALLSQHSQQHASWDHEAGQQTHQDAQKLGPGGEAVVAIF